MKQVFIMGTTLLMATALFSNVYAQVDKQTEAEVRIAAMEAADLLDESVNTIQVCTILSELELLNQKCVDFIIDYRDSIKGVMDRYEKPTPIEKFPDINSNSTSSPY